MAIQADEGRAEEKVEGYKQQLAAESALEPVFDFVELEEVVEDEDDQQEKETPIKDSQEVIKMKEEKEKEKKRNRKRKKLEK